MGEAPFFAECTIGFLVVDFFLVLTETLTRLVLKSSLGPLKLLERGPPLF